MPSVKLLKYGLPSPSMNTSFPAWLTKEKIYKGTIRLEDGSYVKVSPDFVAALVHATILYASGGFGLLDEPMRLAIENAAKPCSVDALGENDKFIIAQYTAGVTYDDTPMLLPVKKMDTAIKPVVSVAYALDSGRFSAIDHRTKKVPTDDAFPALFLVLWPIMMNERYSSTFAVLFENFVRLVYGSSSKPIPPRMAKDDADDAAAKLICQMYREFQRVCTEKLSLSSDSTITVTLLPEAAMHSPSYAATSRRGSDFVFFPAGAAAAVMTASTGAEDFAGKYRFGHELTEEEKELVPVLTEKDVISPTTVTACRMVKETTGKNRQVRNIFLYGPTGTGKSKMSRHIAAGLGLSYGSINCNADTSIVDLLVSCMPKDGGEKLDTRNFKGLPSIEDMTWMPEDAWYEMTKENKPGVTDNECIDLAYERITGQKVENVSVSQYAAALIEATRQDAEARTGQQFIYVESPLVYAARHGGLCEIQEPSTIVQGGVLPGLNSLLDDEGTIFLPHGETVHRHPDCVVVATTNVSYEGCRRINQSFLRRFQFKAYIPNPPEDELIKRVKAMIGYQNGDYVDTVTLKMMVQAVEQVRQYCRENDLSDGDVGICEVADWANTANILKSCVQAAQYTIVPSATQDPDQREAIENIVGQKFND